jgi:hypothetical protein
MSVIDSIRQHICSLPLGEIFATRNFLEYGSRACVDASMSRLVRQGMLRRLANGIFARADSSPTVEEIAKAKAERFGKELSANCCDSNDQFHSPEKSNCDTNNHRPHSFGIDGQTSSFNTIHGRVILVHECSRKRGRRR